ncbi:MAG: hypothetical protein IJS90_06095, partial [Clostridia bacterium]|nr:hypothetical protein [Clostridia bacterium]
IHQYDLGLNDPEKAQTVCTLEPVYPGGGGNEKWVKWYLKENYNDKCLSLAYAQFGQENSFGWEDISKGLPMQMRLLGEKVKDGEIELMTLGEAGEWFSASYDLTPAAAMCTDSDWSEENYKSVWYCSRFYRVNVIYRDGLMWIRDLHIFDASFKEQFLNSANKSRACGNFNLPVVDGFRFSKGNVRAGLYPYKDGKVYKADGFESEALGEDVIKVTAGKMTFILTPEEIRFDCSEDRVVLRFVYADVPYIPYGETEQKKLRLSFSGFSNNAYSYSLDLSKGVFSKESGALEIVPENGLAQISFC